MCNNFDSRISKCTRDFISILRDTCPKIQRIKKGINDVIICLFAIFPLAICSIYSTDLILKFSLVNTSNIKVKNWCGVQRGGGGYALWVGLTYIN